MTEPRGEVFDIGYQSYAGAREGRARAMKALWANGVRTSLGLGRGWMSKLMPALLFLILMIPALGFPVIVAMFGDLGELADIIPGQDDYYWIVSAPLIIFSAIVAPELLIADRRSGVINLYLVRPLTSTDYVLGRWLAFFSVTLAMVIIPQVTLMVGLILGADDQVEYIRENWLDVPRFVGAGLAIALFVTTLPMAVSAFAGRRAYASVFVIGVWFITLAIAGIVMEGAPDDAVKWVPLAAVGQAPLYFGDVIFGKGAVENAQGFGEHARNLPDAIIAGWFLVVTLIPGLLLWRRYWRLIL